MSSAPGVDGGGRGTGPGGSKPGAVNLVLAGVGGQGILLASRILCEAVLSEGERVNAFESHGMAQRGGAVYASLRWGDGAHSALIGEGDADLLVALEPVEALRRLSLVGPRTTAVLNRRGVPSISVSSLRGASYPSIGDVLAALEPRVERVVTLDATEIAERLGKTALLSTAMVGAALGSGRLPLDRKPLVAAVTRLVPKAYLEENLWAFDLGERAVA